MAAREDTTEQAALREILKRIMYTIWGAWATYQLASAREMWVYLEDQFTERETEGERERLISQSNRVWNEELNASGSTV